MKAHYHRRALSTESARWFNPNIAMTWQSEIENLSRRYR